MSSLDQQREPRQTAASALLAVRARLWLVVVFAGIGALAGVTVNAAADERQARAILAFEPLSENAAVVALGIDAPGPPPAEQLRSDAVLAKLGGDPRALREQLTVAGLGDERQVVLQGESRGDRAVIDLVNRWADEIVRSRTVDLQKKIAAAHVAAADGLRGSAPRSLRAATLRDSLNRLAVLERTVRGDTRVVATAAGSVRAHTVSVELLAALGALTGFAFAIVWATVDGRMRTPAALRDAFGVPLLATVGGRADDRAAGGALRAKVDAGLGRRAEGAPPARVLVLGVNGRQDAEGVARALAGAYAGATTIEIAAATVGGHADLTQSARADAVVVCARLASTSRADAAALELWWDGLDVRPLGVVAVAGAFHLRRVRQRRVRGAGVRPPEPERAPREDGSVAPERAHGDEPEGPGPQLWAR